MDISKRVYQRLRLIGYGTVPDFFCCSAEYRQPINRRTNPCPTPTHLPPLSKVRCCRPKKFGRLPEGLLAPLRFAPHSYRPLSKVRCCRRKNSGDYRRNCRTNPRPAPTLPKTALSLSLFVGERACSSRCTEYCHSHNNCKKTIIPQKSPSHLPPLSKGGGLTAKHKLLLCCVLIAYPRPFYHQTFLPSRRRDCYIPSPHTNPRKTAPSHSLFVLRVRQPHFPQNKIRPRFHGGELIKSLIYKY